MQKFDTYQDVTNAIIAALEAGAKPWAQEWQGSPLAMPHHATAHRIAPRVAQHINANDHTMALLVIARAFGLEREGKELARIRRDHMDIGYMVDSLLAERTACAQSMADQLAAMDPEIPLILWEALPQPSTAGQRPNAKAVQLLALRAAAPLRSTGGQHSRDVIGLPLFEPTLF